MFDCINGRLYPQDYFTCLDKSPPRVVYSIPQPLDTRGFPPLLDRKYTTEGVNKVRVDGSFEITLFFNKDIRFVNNNENAQLGDYGSKPYNKDFIKEITLWDLDKERQDWGNTIYKTTVGARTHNDEYIK